MKSKLFIYFLLGLSVKAYSIPNALKLFRIVKQSEKVLLEKFGKYSRTLEPGIHFTWPLVEQARVDVWTDYKSPNPNEKGTFWLRQIDRIDLRESVYDYPQQSVITHDNVVMLVKPVLYCQIHDVYAASYNVDNLPEAIEKLAQATLRNIIGSMTLEEALNSREKINERLRIVLDQAIEKWGVNVNRVEIQEIEPPREIMVAMQKQLQADREKRATILYAQGEKEAAILKAEGQREAAILKAIGEKESAILNSEGQSEARRKLAQAESDAISLIREGSQSDPLVYILTQKYIESLSEIANSNNSKVLLLPNDNTNIGNLLATINGILDKKDNNNNQDKL